MQNEIDLEELRLATNALFDALVQERGKRVAISSVEDFYWEVPLECLNKIRDQQPQLDVGRLTDDWGFVRPIAEDKSIATPLALIHIAPLLRFLAQTK